MKPLRILFSSFLGALVFLSVSAEADVTERYGFKQARIVVEKKTRNASLESTTLDTVYLDQWGWVEVRHSHQKQNILMLDMTTESRIISIMENEWLTSYDPVKRKGTKTRNPFYDPTGGLTEQQGKDSAAVVSKDFETTTIPKGTEEIAGRPCEVVETKTGKGGMESVTTTWTWKGFVMRSVTVAAGTEITEQVLDIDESIGVGPGLLKIPDDVQISDP